MFKRFNTNYIALLVLIDSALVQLALLVAMALRYKVPIIGFVWPQAEVQNLRVELHIGVGLLAIVCFASMSVYSARRVIRWIDELQHVVMGTVLLSLLLTGVLYLINLNLPRLAFLYFFLISTSLLVGYRWLLRVWHKTREHHPDTISRILIVGTTKLGIDIVREFRQRRWPGMQLVGFLDDDPNAQGQQVEGLPVLGALKDTSEAVAKYGVDEVLIALPLHAQHQLVNLVAMLYEQPVRIRVVPDLIDLAFHNASVESVGGILLIGLRDPAIDGVQRLAKRLMDMLISTLALLIMSPVLVATAVAIKLEDGGPVLYKAQRVGENGKLFWMWKFRSMVVNADQMQQAVLRVDSKGDLIHKTPEDPRVTRVGRFIRRTSIDELPQLFNVLTGRMSMVGPRPELPWMVALYEPYQRKRFAVPQGITGWWQVNGRSDVPMHLNTEQDLYYIQNYSLWLDLRILWKTIAVVVSGKGAY